MRWDNIDPSAAWAHATYRDAENPYQRTCERRQIQEHRALLRRPSQRSRGTRLFPSSHSFGATCSRGAVVVVARHFSVVAFAVESAHGVVINRKQHRPAADQQCSSRKLDARGVPKTSSISAERKRSQRERNEDSSSSLSPQPRRGPSKTSHRIVNSRR
jgi:hypothetical protein